MMLSLVFSFASTKNLLCVTTESNRTEYHAGEVEFDKAEKILNLG
jgi:hypothetical protein